MYIPIPFLLFSLLIISSVYSETILRGETDNLVCERTGNPFIIDSTLTVPKGGKLVFNEGCIVFFKSYTGIEVSGNFIVKGTLKNPVVFTSINDNHFNQHAEVFPQPLDWNGLTFNLSSDTVFMENFKLLYSVFGIKSWNNRIVLHNGIFSDNGQYDFVVNDALQTVTQGVAYSYNYTPQSSDTLTLQMKMKLYEQKVQRRKTITKISLFSGIAVTLFDGFAWYKWYNLAYVEYMKRGVNYSEVNRKKANWKSTAIIAAPVGGTLLLTSLLFYVIPVHGAPVSESKDRVSFGFDPTPKHLGVSLTMHLSRNLF